MLTTINTVLPNGFSTYINAEKTLQHTTLEHKGVKFEKSEHVITDLETGAEFKRTLVGFECNCSTFKTLDEVKEFIESVFFNVPDPIVLQ